MKLTKLRKSLWILPLFIILISPARCPALASQAMIEPHAQAMPLLPFLDYIIDPSMALDIEEAARATGWQPFIPDKLPREEGVTWLRFTIAPLAPDARPQTFLLDMGQSVPGVPALFDPFSNELSGAQEWRENLPAQRNILLLPEASQEAIPCYIRIDGLPGPWFAPMIRTPQNAASNWGSLAQTGAILALAVVMFICLLRGVSEKGQWRYWTALFVAVALLQALIGMPTVSDSFSLIEMAAVLSPGIALMLMPHVGRHLLQTKKYSRSIDVQLFLLAFPGAILAILPLVPGWTWLYRWLELWPAAAIIFVPTALGAWLLAIPGARRFLLACALPPLIVAAALLGLDFGLPANILASGPTWAIALAALLLAAMRSPVQAVARDENDIKPEKPVKAPKLAPQLPPLEIESVQEEIINLEHPLDDPNLRIIPPSRKQETPEPETDVELAGTPIMPVVSDDTHIHGRGAMDILLLEKRENALREPIDAILREGAALLRCSLPASARQSAEEMIGSARQLANILSRSELPSQEDKLDSKNESFNLQRILRNAHDSVAAHAEYSGIALSWYMPPHLAQIYRGDAGSLEDTLSMLLESAVRSAHHGAIKVSVKRVPDSSDPGHLLFTVTDDGNGYPPLDRSSLALAKAWELTGEYGGYLSVECSQHGATIAFTAHFSPIEEEIAEAEAAENPHIILVCDDDEAKRHLSRIIDELPCNLSYATSAPEAVAIQTQNPAVLAICQGRFSRPASADMVRQLVRIARQSGLKCYALAITVDESEWPLLKASGFTHAMLEPVDPEVLRHTIMDLIESTDKDAHAIGGEEAAAKPKEEAPSMLIEQTFPIAPVFEGPDWLGSHGDEEEAPTPAPKQPAPNLQTSSAPDSAIEWVGEPMPLGTPIPSRVPQPAPQAVSKDSFQAAPQTVARKTTQSSGAPESALEWVGEPMPVPKTAQEQQAGGELLDFIVGVNEEKSNPIAAPVKEFVESSVNMVASTLSNILGKTSGAATVEEPIKARSDPAIIALLERMDAAMRHANAAFAAKNGQAIAESTGLIAADAEKFGLRSLSRMAKCVERAAVANEMGAVADLLPELGIAVERNRITLAQRKQG